MLETRDSYTDQVISALVEAATSGRSASPLVTGAVEIAAGFYGRAFASATVNDPALSRVLSPVVLSSIARSLIRHSAAARVGRDGARHRRRSDDAGGPERSAAPGAGVARGAPGPLTTTWLRRAKTTSRNAIRTPAAPAASAHTMKRSSALSVLGIYMPGLGRARGSHGLSFTSSASRSRRGNRSGFGGS